MANQAVVDLLQESRDTICDLERYTVDFWARKGTGQGCQPTNPEANCFCPIGAIMKTANITVVDDVPLTETIRMEFLKHRDATAAVKMLCTEIQEIPDIKGWDEEDWTKSDWEFMGKGTDELYQEIHSIVDINDSHMSHHGDIIEAFDRAIEKAKIAA